MVQQFSSALSCMHRVVHSQVHSLAPGVCGGCGRFSSGRVCCTAVLLWCGDTGLCWLQTRWRFGVSASGCAPAACQQHASVLSVVDPQTHVAGRNECAAGQAPLSSHAEVQEAPWPEQQQHWPFIQFVVHYQWGILGVLSLYAACSSMLWSMMLYDDAGVSGTVLHLLSHGRTHR